MKIQMQCFILISAALTAVSALASAEPQSNGAATVPNVYRYEITVPGANQPLPINVALGDIKTVTVDGKVTEYTKNVTTVPASIWAAMVAHNTTPQHDFVECGKKTCSYGTKANLVDQVSVTVRIDEKGGKLITTGTFDSRLVENVPSVQLNGKPGIDIPTVSGQLVTKQGTLSAGDTLTLFKTEAGDAVQVKMVSVE